MSNRGWPDGNDPVAAELRRALDEVRPYGVDVCSGVRTEGRLDEAKLAAFVAAVATR